MIAFGIGRLGLAPDAFWNLTPREIAAIAGAAERGPRAPGRSTLAALMAAHPDRPPR